jgi:hypothetical protein
MMIIAPIVAIMLIAILTLSASFLFRRKWMRVVARSLSAFEVVIVLIILVVEYG